MNQKFCFLCKLCRIGRAKCEIEQQRNQISITKKDSNEYANSSNRRKVERTEQNIIPNKKYCSDTFQPRAKNNKESEKQKDEHCIDDKKATTKN